MQKSLSNDLDRLYKLFNCNQSFWLDCEVWLFCHSSVFAVIVPFVIDFFQPVAITPSASNQYHAEPHSFEDKYISQRTECVQYG